MIWGLIEIVTGPVKDPKNAIILFTDSRVGSSNSIIPSVFKRAGAVKRKSGLMERFCVVADNVRLLTNVSTDERIFFV